MIANFRSGKPETYPTQRDIDNWAEAVTNVVAPMGIATKAFMRQRGITRQRLHPFYQRDGNYIQTMETHVSAERPPRKFGPVFCPIGCQNSFASRITSSLSCEMFANAPAALLLEIM